MQSDPHNRMKPIIKIGKAVLGRKPVVVAVVDEMIPVPRLIALGKKGVGMLEVRVDLIKRPLPEIAAYIKNIRVKVKLPIIGTVRGNRRNEGSRLDIFKAVAPFVDCIDIELGSPIAQEVRALAKGKALIVSEHDFKKTPSGRTMRSMVEQAVRQGADIVKIAAMAKNDGDSRRLLRFVQKSKVPLVAFAMGEKGRRSRIEACSAGSLFTYGYITRAVAPGQLSAERLLREIG